MVLQGSAGGHMLLVEHTRCEEHGELVHDAQPHHRASGPRAESSTETFQPSPDRSADGTHEHCALTVDRRDAAVPIAGSRIVRLADEAAPTFFSVDAFIVVDTKRFLDAPKHSPPA